MLLRTAEEARSIARAAALPVCYTAGSTKVTHAVHFVGLKANFAAAHVDAINHNGVVVSPLPLHALLDSL
jgi:hypothetical protein